ncbi:MAG: molybdopterin biosynthesis protein MoeB [Rhodobacteraceae bacterium]|nr:MAG: molybdopterin biosynthesis protein MoeB [Paracoccaceae bacterium]
MTIFGVEFSPERLQFILMMVLVVGVLLYVRILRKYSKAPPSALGSDAPTEAMSASELERYARHIVLREIGGAGQTKLRNARVLVVGVGGLGSPVLQYLAAAGVGTLGFVDDDVVGLSNLQRQVLFNENHLDMPKVFAAEAQLKALNPFIVLRPYNRKFDADLLSDYDLVLDGTDNFATRQAVNAACVATKTPLIFGAIAQWEGQVGGYDPTGSTPCYACVFPDEPKDGLAPSCAQAGVMGALPGVIGSLMATEAIKVITGAGDPLAGSMILYDALSSQTRKISTPKDANCKVCA